MFYVDIAVPRDIDPRIGDLDSCYLYNLDDLKSIIDNDYHENNKSLQEASVIIDESLNKYVNWENSDNTKDITNALRSYIKEIVDLEIKSNSIEIINKDLISSRIANKILHLPVNKIKQESNLDNNLYLSVLSDIFDLGNDQESSNENSNIYKIKNEKNSNNRN